MSRQTQKLHLPRRNPSQAVCIQLHPGRWNVDLTNADRKRYYTLAIFENETAYVKWLTSVGVEFDPDEDKRYGRSGACTLYDRDYHSNRLGFICLRIDAIDTEIVAHEAVHAALGFVYRTTSLAKFQFGRDDELLAYPTGVIANQMVIGINNYNMQQAKASKKRK